MYNQIGRTSSFSWGKRSLTFLYEIIAFNCHKIVHRSAKIVRQKETIFKQANRRIIYIKSTTGKNSKGTGIQIITHQSVGVKN